MREAPPRAVATARPPMQRNRVTCYVGIGSNLGDLERNVEQACVAMDSIAQTQLRACSPLYRNKAQGFVGPDFVNAVAELSTWLNAYELLAALQAIEVRMGRPEAASRAAQPKTSRVMDLDILLFGDACIESSTLRVPHPGMQDRDFVQVPLAQLRGAHAPPGAL